MTEHESEYERVRRLFDAGGSEGVTLLDELHAALIRYVVFPSPAAAVAVTLWIAATHAQLAWEHATRLALLSPEKRCGKSRLLDVIEATCHRPLITVNISPAALVRSIGDDPPTLLLDEADTVFGRKAADSHEDLRGIVNAGHQRNRPYIRWDMNSRTREACATFAMVALAGIGDLPDTITDRSVVVRMRRRARGEAVRPFRSRRDAPPLNDLRDRLDAWVRDHLDELAEAEPELPVEDRAADTWESLVAVADLAGGDWPARARKAAQVLTGAEQEDDPSVGVRLLTDLRAIFDGADALHTGTVLDRLHKLEEAPWGDWYGRPFNARDLAKLLRPYGVHSKDVRESGSANLKGYRRDDLHEAWCRYLPRDSRDKGDSAGQTRRGDQIEFRDIPRHEAPDDPCRGSVADSENPSATGLTCNVTAVAAVAHGVRDEDSASIGPCARCGTATRRYGDGASSFCATCRHKGGAA